MTSPTSRKKRLIIFLIFIVLFLLLIPVVTLYATGYRLDNGLTLQPTGGVYVYYPEAGVDVSIKGSPAQRTTIFAKSVLIQNLTPGTYEVDVSKDGYSYWKKDVLVVEKRVSEAYPFLVLEPVATTTIPINQRLAVSNLFVAPTSTATTTAGISKSAVAIVSKEIAGIIGTTTASSSIPDDGILWKDIYLYNEKNGKGDKLMALWKGDTNGTPFYFCEALTGLCDSTIVATDSSSPIKHFDFYPSRNDVVVYSNSDGVFVTELDNREPQNFVTLAKGNVDFRIQNGHIYIEDKSIKGYDIYELTYD